MKPSGNNLQDVDEDDFPQIDRDVNAPTSHNFTNEQLREMQHLFEEFRKEKEEMDKE